MIYKNSSNIIYQYTADRLKLRRKVLKLTNDVIAQKKIFVHYAAYKDWATDKDEPERFESKINPQKTKYDASMISRILNNKRGKISNRNSPNPYLIPPAYEELLVKQLQFDNITELFWGKESVELEFIVKSFYATLFKEVLEDNQTELSKLLNLCLIDYVPYSKSLSYYHMILNHCIEMCSYFNNHTAISKKELCDILKTDTHDLCENLKNGDPLLSPICGTIIYIMDMLNIGDKNTDALNDFKILEGNLKYFREEAIGRIIFLNYEDLRKLYQEYFFKQKNFKLLNKKISKFISTILVPFFKEKLGNQDEFKSYSLGYRVKNLIETDFESIFSYTSQITQEQYTDCTNPISNLYKELLKINLKYISGLRHIQWRIDRASVDISSKEDIERFYLQTLTIENHHKNWLENYTEHLSHLNLTEYGDYMEEDSYEELKCDNE